MMPDRGPTSGITFTVSPRDVIRFWRFVQKDEGESCWMWLSTVVHRYGNFKIAGLARPIGAHRVSFAIANGPIPAGLCVIHACDNPACVRPDHLALGTHADNMRDMWAKGRGPSHPRKPVCVRGHVRTDLLHRCRECERERHARRRAALRLARVADY